MCFRWSVLERGRGHCRGAVCAAAVAVTGRYTPLRCTVLRTALLILPRAARRHGGSCRFCAGGGVWGGEPGAWGEVTAGLRVSRPVLVGRLLELDAAGALMTAHVCAGAQVGGAAG